MTNITKADARLFINWLETKPKDEMYNYILGNQCLIAQYLTAIGYENVNCGPHKWTAVDERDRDIPPELDEISREGLEFGSDYHSFGSALRYAKRKFKKLFPEGY